MKIITISREYGAGGTTVGKAVAKELGIEVYDKDIIRATAKEMGLEYDQIKDTEEEVSTAETIMRRITPISYEHKDVMYDVQKQFVLDIVKKGPCVIVGRLAEAILREAGIDAINVYLYSPEQSRIRCVHNLDPDVPENEIIKFMRKQDRARRAYYELYTDRHFGDEYNYDLMLNTGVLGYDTCIKLIVELAKLRG